MKRKRTVHEVAFRLAYDVQTQMTGKVGEFGVELTPMKMRALRVIWSSDEATAQDIVSTIKRDKAQVARLVEDLCEQNLVERRMNPNDKRSKLLRLTDCGRDIFNKVEQIEQSFANELIEGIPKEELEVFFGVADKLSENMKSMN